MNQPDEPKQGAAQPLSETYQELFARKLSEDQLQETLALLDCFVDLMDQAPAQRYTLAYGSLLGALLYKGMIPWDDDIDLFCRMEDYWAIRNRCMASNVLHWGDFPRGPKGNGKMVSKVWFRQSKKLQKWGYPWSWPFLDIAWLKEHENGMRMDLSCGFLYPENEIFPPVREPFEGRMLWCPGQGTTLIRRAYPRSLQEAVPAWYDHMGEHSANRGKNHIRPPLTDLIPMYPVLAETLPRLQNLSPPPSKA